VLKHLTVRIWGLDSGGRAVNQEASTVDISAQGVRLSGVCSWNAPGEVVGLRYLNDKARYRIVWVGKPGTGLAGQLGLHCLDEGKVIWGDALAADAAQPSARASLQRAQAATMAASPPTLRRPSASAGKPARASAPLRAVRVNCQGGARVQEVGKPAGQFATLADISSGGCYIETVSPLPLNTPVDLRLDLNGIRVETRAIVKVSNPNVGMGVEFCDLRPEERSKLHAMIASVQHEDAVKSAF
jgi:hypothetical protein